MATTPLDLQINLSQMSNVGMEQSAMKSAETASANFHGKQLIKESMAYKDKVIKLKDESAYLSVLNENEDGKKNDNELSNKPKNQLKKIDEENEDKIIEIDDPFVGNNIDIET